MVYDFLDNDDRHEMNHLQRIEAEKMTCGTMSEAVIATQIARIRPT